MLQQGEALLFPGGLRHKANAVTAGSRCVLVAFIVFVPVPEN